MARVESVQDLLRDLVHLVSLQNDAYQDMQETLRRMETKISDIERRQQEQQEFVDNQFTDAVQARDVYRWNSEQFKLKAEGFKEKLNSLQDLTAHIGVLTDHPRFVDKPPALIPEPEPSDFKVYVHSDVDGSNVMVVDESLDV